MDHAQELINLSTNIMAKKPPAEQAPAPAAPQQ